MEPSSLTWVGSPCGLHGPYIFYKAFRFHSRGARRTPSPGDPGRPCPRILSLGDFFLVSCSPGEPVCVAELQLLWEERTGNKQLLSSSKLYFLPEDTPQGRTVDHGEDEVIAVSEKVIVRLEDLVKWTVWEPQAWTRGLKAVPLKPGAAHRDQGRNGQRDIPYLRYRESTLNSGLNFKDVLREKAELGEDPAQKKVLVLSYPQYCRYRSVLARLGQSPPSLLTDQAVLALGGIASPSENTHVLYCRDTFEHPTLLHNESVCDEFAPNLKGRPRKKKPSLSQRRDSQSQGQGSELKGQCQGSPAAKEAGATEGRSSHKVKAGDRTAISKPKGSGSNGNISSKRTPLASAEEKGEGGVDGGADECRAEEQAFLVSLYKYMKERKTPIERIPYLGFKQINLWTMFQGAQKLGGYELITARRQWKNVYDELGGNPGSTSAATCTRRHYERLILPYERFTKGEEDRPLPPAKPRKQEAVSGGTEPADSVGGHAPKAKLTNGVKQQAQQKPCLDKDDAVASKAQDQSVPDAVEKCPQLKVEPQLLLTPLEALLPLQPNTERWSTGEMDRDMKDHFKEEQEEEEEEEEVVCRSTRNGCDLRGRVPGSWETDPSHLASPPIATDTDVFPLAAAKIVSPTHSEQWQQEQADAKEQCHVGLVSPTLTHRALLSPTAPDAPSQQADLPRREGGFLDFTSPLYSPRVNPGIMSPLAKKKLLSQVSGTGLPGHSHLPPSYGPPPPLISSLSNGVAEEAAAQPAAGSDSAAAVNRPSVIQLAQSFRSRGGGAHDAREAAQRQSDRVTDMEERAPSPLYSHGHDFPPPAYPSLPYGHMRPHSRPEEPYQRRLSPPPMHAPDTPTPGQTPPGFISDLYSSPHLHSLYKNAESHLRQGHGVGLEFGAGRDAGGGLEMRRDHGELPRPEYKHHHHHNRHHQQQKYVSFPHQLGGAESNHPQQQHGLRFSHEPPHDESQRHHTPGLNLPRDGVCSEPFPRSVSHLHRDFSYAGLQDKSVANGNRPPPPPLAVAAADDQPTDLSLPKSSPPKLSAPPPSSSSSQSLPQPAIMHRDAPRSPGDARASSPPLLQNGHRALGVAYHPRACRVPPMTTSAAHTHGHGPRQGAAPAEPHPRTALNGHAAERGSDGERHRHRGGTERERREQGEREAAELYCRADDPAGGVVRPILSSKAAPQNVCAARPLKRPLEESESGLTERKVRAVTPMHTSSSSCSSSSSSLFAASKDVVVSSSSPARKPQAHREETGDDSVAVHPAAILKSPPPPAAHEPARTPLRGGFADGGGGQKGGAAAPLPLLSAPTAAPHIFNPALYSAGAFSLSQVQDLCGDALGGYPPPPHAHPHHHTHPHHHPHHHHHHALQYLKDQSAAAVLSPLVPPFAIHSFMMQRQLLAQAAASPAHMYRHPMAAATYGELLHHGLYPVSINPQPAFSAPQLNSVHPSTKLS